MHWILGRMSSGDATSYIDALSEQLINVFVAHTNIWHNSWDLAFVGYNRQHLVSFVNSALRERGFMHGVFSEFWVGEDTRLVYFRDEEEPICSTPMDIDLLEKSA